MEAILGIAQSDLFQTVTTGDYTEAVKLRRKSFVSPATLPRTGRKPFLPKMRTLCWGY